MMCFLKLFPLLIWSSDCAPWLPLSAVLYGIRPCPENPCHRDSERSFAIVSFLQWKWNSVCALFQVHSEPVSKYFISLSVVLSGVRRYYLCVYGLSLLSSWQIHWDTVKTFLKCDYIMLHLNITSFIGFKVMPVVVLKIRSDGLSVRSVISLL